MESLPRKHVRIKKKGRRGFASDDPRLRTTHEATGGFLKVGDKITSTATRSLVWLELHKISENPVRIVKICHFQSIFLSIPGIFFKKILKILIFPVEGPIKRGGGLRYSHFPG